MGKGVDHGLNCCVNCCCRHSAIAFLNNALPLPPLSLQAGLRTACLAAALSLNKTLRSLDLGGWTWDELGNGCALPFLTLGCCPGTALTCVKVWGWDWGGGGGARQAVVNGCALPFH